MKTTSEESTEFSDEQIELIEFWKMVPIIKSIEPSAFEAGQQEVRSAILEILRRGTEKPLSDGGPTESRHALNAQELLDYVDEKLETKVKLSNIYFHLKALQEVGMVQVVSKRLEGKHQVAYFGRTAKMFLSRESPMDCYGTPFLDAIVDLIIRLNPERKKTETHKLLKSFCEEDHFVPLLEWFKKNEELLTDINIDMVRLFKFLADMWCMNTNESKEIANLLGLPER